MTVLRALAILLIIAGVGAAAIYPALVQNASGYDLGTFRVYDRGKPFRPVTVDLEMSAAPVRVLVDMISDRAPAARPSETVLTLTASIAGRTVMAETLNFMEAAVHDDPPRTGEKSYRAEAGVLTRLDSGPYRFTIGPGDAEGVPMKSVDLILRGGAGVLDPRAQPIGFTLGAVGIMLLLLSFRGSGGRPQGPDTQPPPPRWGRAGGERS